MKRLPPATAAIVLVVAACGGAASPPGDGSGADAGTTATTAASAASPTSTAAPVDPSDTPAAGGGGVIDEGDAVEIPFELSAIGEVWPTNWGRRTIELDELRVGLNAADPRDLIRPIDEPIYEDVDSADEWLEDREQGILLELEGEAMFFPIRILIAHEIVNDRRGDVPFSLTYCPLCNTAAAFDRRVEGEVLRFGVSGLLRNSDLVMWDDRTVSLWQQITGEGIVGDYAGTRLTFLPTALIRWADFRDNHPDGDVLSRPGGRFNYGSNGYVGYTSRSEPYGRFFSGELDPRFEALSRVVGVRVGDVTKAYPFATIREQQAVNDQVDGVPVAVFWGAIDTADPLDSGLIANGDPIGTGIAFARTVAGQVLTFTANGDDTFTDAETGTTWNLLGTALSGELAGRRLDPVLHQNEFWFAWAAFNQGSEVYGG